VSQDTPISIRMRGFARLSRNYRQRLIREAKDAQRLFRNLPERQCCWGGLTIAEMEKAHIMSQDWESRRQQAVSELLSRGYTLGRKKDPSGTFRTGWWCDSRWIAETAEEALRLVNGN
jgi:hypothetical protein